ncbi:MAG: agmatine deiminase family protein [Gammaproteobacteria bacterium]|nr:agmatine deiminase family protein [Gammaproteobacteria bacterium]
MNKLLAEWAPQWGVMLTWPHAGTDWSDMLTDIEAVYLDLASAIAARENLLLVVQDGAHRKHVASLLAARKLPASRIHYVTAASNDTWARDHGPLTVADRSGALTLMNFVFNGWGNKWPADQDNAINDSIAGAFNVGMHSRDFVLEGGAVETDGLGTLLTTKRCLLAETRNPDLDQAGIEQVLAQELGLDRVLWLEHGHLEGDDTDAHIDTLARFASPDHIVFQGCEDPSDSHYQALADMASELAAFRQRNGDAYRLSALPLPKPQHDPDTGRRLPASYANFLIINGAVLLPGYADDNDQRARDIMQAAFPDHDIVMIDCRAVIRGFGSLHCLTMQLPAGLR